jgi:hypothetical protein
MSGRRFTQGCDRDHTWPGRPFPTVRWRATCFNLESAEKGSRTSMTSTRPHREPESEKKYQHHYNAYYKQEIESGRRLRSRASRSPRKPQKNEDRDGTESDDCGQQALHFRSQSGGWTYSFSLGAETRAGVRRSLRANSAAVAVRAAHLHQVS